MADFSEKSNRSVQIFENIEFGRIRTVVGTDGEPWFVGKDVASDMIKRLDEENFISSKLDGMKYELHSSQRIRPVVGTDGEPWFVAKELPNPSTGPLIFPAEPS